MDFAQITFACGFPKRNIQVVLKLFDCPADVLASFDLDCCCLAYNGTRCDRHAHYDYFRALPSTRSLRRLQLSYPTSTSPSNYTYPE